MRKADASDQYLAKRGGSLTTTRRLVVIQF